jgi:hypothetical protein
MIEPGTYVLNKDMTMVDVNLGRMIGLLKGEAVVVKASVGGGKCQLTTPKGDLIAMEMTLKQLQLQGWLNQTSKTKSQVAC